MSRPLKILAWSMVGLSGMLALCLVALVNYDWNRAKPWLNAQVSEATGRPFAIHGDLSIQWHRFDAQDTSHRRVIPWPHVRAEGIVFGNPEWAKAAPDMAQVGCVTFSLSPFALLAKKIMVRNLLLEEPLLFLEREKSGRNNWTFASAPSSAWQFEIDQLRFYKAQIRVVDAIKSADLVIKVETLGARSATGYQLGWNVSGTLGNDVVSGSGKVGALLSLQEQDVRFPVDANVRIGKTAIAISGTVTNPRSVGALDVQLKLATISMAKLYALTGIPFPETTALATEGHLIGEFSRHGSAWKYDKFAGKVGSSDLSGTFEYEGKQPRPYLKATLVSNVLNLQDLAPLIGADSTASKVKRGAATGQPVDRVLPVEPFKAERWTSIDADVKFSGRKIIRARQLPIENVTADLHLQDGVLSLTPLDFGIAGGQLLSTIVLDGRGNAIKAQVKIAARHLKLKQLLPTFQPMQASLGEMNGDASLSATGNSVAAMLGSSNGEIKAFIDGGTVSKMMLEKIGLNIANVILTQLSGDKQAILNCMASDFSVTNGVMQARTFLIDTEDAFLNISGQIDLAQEKLALTIKPGTKSLRIFSLRAPFYVSGSFKQPLVNVDKGVLALKAGSAVALAVMAPVITAIIPLVNVGPGKASPCESMLRDVRKKPVAPPPGVRY